MRLHYSRNPNPRLAVAVARHLGSSVIFVPASPFAPGQAETYRELNPSLSIPNLEEEQGGCHCLPPVAPVGHGLLADRRRG